MPIRPENKDRYPKDWPKISQAIRDRANWRCEECGVKHNAVGCRDADGRFYVSLPTGKTATALIWPQPGEHAWGEDPETKKRHYGRMVRIILTVAHLDHQPENCDPSNLRAWCQRCHNRYDAAMRRAGVAARARARKAVGDLFEGEHGQGKETQDAGH